MLKTLKSLIQASGPNEARDRGSAAGRGMVVVTLPKSGTDYIDNTFMQIAGMKIPDIYSDAERMKQIRTGYYRFDEPVVSIGNFDTQFANAPQIRDYVDNGRLVSMHMGGSHYNRSALLDAGIKRLSVVMRDPRDSTVSMSYHIRKGGPAQRNNLMMFLYLPSDYFEWSDAEQLGYLVRTYLPKAVSWIESWLAPRPGDGDGPQIQFLFFDDLKRDSKAFIRRIADFHGIRNVDYDQLPDAKSMAHFRSGEHDQWKQEFSEDEIRFSDWLIGERLENAFRDAASEQIAGVSSQGDAAAQKAALCSVVCTFPWIKEGFEALRQAASASGTPLSDRLVGEFQTYYADRPAVMKKPWDLIEALQQELNLNGFSSAPTG